MIKRTSEFGAFLNEKIKAARLKKSDLVKTAGIHPSSLSRIIAGDVGVSKLNAVGLVRAVNRLAGRDVASEREALEIAGFAPEEIAARFSIGNGFEVRAPGDFAEDELFAIAENLRLALEISLTRIRERNARQEQKVDGKVDSQISGNFKFLQTA